MSTSGNVIEASNENFRNFFNAIDDIIIIGDLEGRIVFLNEGACRKLGYSREELIGKHILELHPVNKRDEARHILEAMFRRELGRCPLELESKNGILIPVETRICFGKWDGQDCIFSVSKDLSAEQVRLKNIIEGTRLGTWEWNIETGETTFNDRWAEIVGYTLEELAPLSIETWRRLTHPDDLAESERLLNLHFRGISEFYQCESRMRHKNGSWVWVLDRGKVIERDSHGHLLRMYGTHMDITEKKNMEQQIHELAIRDSLTGLYNRRYLLNRLDEIVAEYSRCGRNFCLSIIDIDHFKEVNDTYGHQAGDYVLKEFALTISSTVRQYDLVGRYGGEEFIVITTSAKAQETASMIERVMAMVRGSVFIYQGHKMHFTFSCGVADSLEFLREGFSVEAMIGLADKRLYKAKQAGRDRCVRQ